MISKLIKKSSFILTICLINIVSSTIIIKANTKESFSINLQTTITAQENAVVKLVNSERAKRGIPALKINLNLVKTARLKSQDMASKHYFSHTSPVYGSPFDMMKKFGIKFSAAGENIAMGQTTANAVMNSWMNSSGHRKNILNPVYNQIGVGLAKDSRGQYYWTQQFIKA